MYSQIRARCWLPLAALISILPACFGSTATVWLKDRADQNFADGRSGRGDEVGYDVTIKESTPDFLVVVPKNGNPVDVPCDKVVELSHPGTGMMIAGVTMTLIAISLFRVDRPSNDSSMDWSGPAQALGAAFIIQGLVMSAAGLAMYLPSRARASHCQYGHN